MRKVLLTGASGFIGRHAIRPLIESGFEVHAVRNANTPQKREGVWSHQCDLMDFTRQKALFREIKPEYLLHMAWYAEHGKYWTSPENLKWVKTSTELFLNFARYGGRRAVFAGTCAEYDWSYGYCSEDVTPLRPSTVYGTCKKSTHEILRRFSRKNGIEAAWGRVFFLYGPGEHPDRLVSKVARSLMKGEPARCTHGNQVRDFLFVEDVADAFTALLKSRVEGAINIASGKPVAVKEVIHKIADKLNRVDLVELGAIDQPEKDPPFMVAEVRKLADEVKWKPKFDLDSGLDSTISAIEGALEYERY